MTTASNENGTATEDIVTQYEGAEIEIGFNSKYILEMINNLDDDEILHTKIMSFKKFMALIKSGKIVDPPSIIAVLTYAIKNKLY